MDSLTMAASKAEVKTPAAAVAARLIERRMANADSGLLYVTRSEVGADELAQALRTMAPGMAIVHLVPWDCLPYDRAGPSAERMGRRMDALLAIQIAGPSAFVVASLEALLQRVPPAEAVAAAFLPLATGMAVDLEHLRSYAAKTGYLFEELVDEPGDIAFRDEIIDIFPPASHQPLRILLDEDGAIGEIRTFDPASQRTIEAIEQFTVGPASELIQAKPEDVQPPQSSAQLERILEHCYDKLDTVFDGLKHCDVCLAPGIDERLAMYLDIIEEARRANDDLGESSAKAGSLYLSQDNWDAALSGCHSIGLDLAGIEPLPDFIGLSNPRQAFADYAEQQAVAGNRILVAGDDSRADSLTRRLQRRHGAVETPTDWQGAVAAAEATVLQARFDIAEGFADRTARIAVIAVADVLGPQAVAAGNVVALLAEPELSVGDLVVHEDHGIGLFRALETVEIDGLSRDAMRLDYYGDDSILVPIEEFGRIWRYGSAEGAVGLDRLHTDAWAKKKAQLARDIRAAAKHLLSLAAQRQREAAEIIAPPQISYGKLVARFPYAETPDQSRAIDAVLEDLASGHPMNRLICGDVGFGKTEIALRAAAAVALSGKQVVVLAPTTVLARQHFDTFKQRFSDTGVKVAMLSRLVAAPAAKQVKAELQTGEATVVVATQAILARDVEFKNLALVIVDEEHRFGTKAKQALASLATGLHQLTMTATPIPRTLQSAMVGIQEVSILATPPVRRRPIRTYRRAVDLPLLKVALLREKRRGGQSFVVLPRIEDIDGVRRTLQSLVPDLTVLTAHGKMPAAEMEEAMIAFGRGDGDILLSTNIIENGLDIPRANTMLIWHADRFGLAQLHQLRGRVGRGRAQGVVYLLTDGQNEEAGQAAARLEIVVGHDRLGDGLAISAHDLDQRGAGDLVGEDQAGHLKLLGVSLYQHMLARTVAALRGEPVARRHPPEINIGMVGTIPGDYVKDASVRINLYARLLKLTTPAGIDGFAEELVDRFGDLPEETDLLLRLAKLRIGAMQSDIAKLDVGPLGAAVTFGRKPTARQWKRWTHEAFVTQRDNRLFAALETAAGAERLEKVSAWLESLRDGK